MRNLCFLFSCIKIGYISRKSYVSLRGNKIYISTLNILYVKGYIRGFYLDPNLGTIFIFLKYYKNAPLLFNVFDILKPTFQINVTLVLLKKYLNSNINLPMFLSTSRGILDFQDSLLINTGGKLLFKIGC
jgi:ribosomal protein S8